jgi:hypothetical protein
MIPQAKTTNGAIYRKCKALVGSTDYDFKEKRELPEGENHHHHRAGQLKEDLQAEAKRIKLDLSNLNKGEK